MGVYPVVLKADDGMVYDTQEFNIHAGTTATPETFATTPRLYPNPFKDKLFIETKGEVELTIYSISGEQLKHYRLNNPKNGIDLKELPDGIYFLRLQAGSEVVTRKVVKL